MYGLPGFGGVGANTSNYGSQFPYDPNPYAS